MAIDWAAQQDRRHNQREQWRGLDPAVYAIEPLLRERCGLSGIFEQSIDIVRRDTGRQFGRKRIVHVLEQLCDLKTPTAQPYLLYNFTLFVGYFTGWANDYPPENLNQVKGRQRHALRMPDCPERRAMLDELRPHELRFKQKFEGMDGKGPKPPVPPPAPPPDEIDRSNDTPEDEGS